MAETGLVQEAFISTSADECDAELGLDSAVSSTSHGVYAVNNVTATPDERDADEDDQDDDADDSDEEGDEDTDDDEEDGDDEDDEDDDDEDADEDADDEDEDDADSDVRLQSRATRVAPTSKLVVTGAGVDV